MRYLSQRAEHDDKEYHDERIAACKAERRSRLKPLLPVVVKRFDEYMTLGVNTHKLEPSSAAAAQAKGDFHALFENKRGIADLLARIYALSPSACPMCGQPVTPTTVDHVVGKDQFPEFSIFGPNLLPCCGDCNSRKGDLVDPSQRKTLNPYYDAFLNAQVIQAEVIQPFEIPKIVLSPRTDSLNADDGAVCRAHIERINWSWRFEIYCLTYYFQSWRTFWAGGRTSFTADDISQALQAKIAPSVLAHGANNWEAVFLTSLIKQREVLDFWSSNGPPTNDEAYTVRAREVLRQRYIGRPS